MRADYLFSILVTLCEDKRLALTSPRGHSVSVCGELFASTILRKQGSMHLYEAGSLVATLGLPSLQGGVDVKD